MKHVAKQVIISVILLITLLFGLVLAHRIYTKRRIHGRNLQLPENSIQPSAAHNIPPVSNIPPGWRRIPGTFTPSRAGNGLHFTPSRQGQGDVVVNIPIGVQFCNSRGLLSRTHTSPNSDTPRAVVDDTPSVWGIDLGRRGARGGLRSGAAVLVPPPGAIVVASTASAPGAVRVQRGVQQRGLQQRGVQRNVGLEEGEELPRYEEPPPGYVMNLEEGGTGGTGVRATPGEVAEGSHGSDEATAREHTAHVVGVPDPVRDLPTSPEPAVTREGPAI